MTHRRISICGGGHSRLFIGPLAKTLSKLWWIKHNKCEPTEREV